MTVIVLMLKIVHKIWYQVQSVVLILMILYRIQLLLLILKKQMNVYQVYI